MAKTAEKRYAILIASSRYPDEPGLTDLRCLENDVDALDAVLCSPDFGAFTETFVFKNRPSHEVLEKIETVLADAGRDDLVLIYFSGHGKLNPAGQLCLAAPNTKLRALGSTSIPVGSIKAYFDHSVSRKKVFLLDCCYSGAAGKSFIKGGDDQLRLMSRGQGTFIMTASTGIEVAEEKEGDQYGLFTKHIVEGIRSGEADKDEDGFVDMQELYEYVHENVQKEGVQKPMQWWLQGKGKLLIAKSGRVAKEKRRQELRTKLYELAAQGWLSDGIVRAAVNVIFLPDKEMTAKDRECLLLIEQFAGERISAGNFVECWMKTCLAPKFPPPPKSKLLLLVFILAAVSCVAAGAGWYFFREPSPAPLPMLKMGKVSVSSRTLPSLSHTNLQPLSPLPLPPAMGTISVSKKRVNSLPQIKFQPLPKAERIPQQDRTIGQYIDHGDGTVTDTKTGLMWKRCSEGLSGGDCEEGKAERYTFDEAVQRFKDVKYAGHADLRLPTIDELKTLVYCSEGKDKEGDCNDGSAEPTINQQAFPNTHWAYWSGSPSASSSDRAWRVYFSSGSSSIYPRAFSHAVRLVRGGSDFAGRGGHEQSMIKDGDPGVVSREESNVAPLSSIVFVPKELQTSSPVIAQVEKKEKDSFAKRSDSVETKSSGSSVTDDNKRERRRVLSTPPPSISIDRLSLKTLSALILNEKVIKIL
ncbi:MAG: DUF1566 domain-containing protein [Candidatus Electrothrix aestuarii]|uniref:DUF1566 domain-containing protein n=1 Tax=Candidatus Electrothrix aestuarii TaxID=3062594 RepID=A0AAU8LR09_9BACT|nr:DUF1566 domain-containing protein [Candidatus Electrothrix aestuarii]